MVEPERLQANAEQAAAPLKAMSNPKQSLILYMLCGSPDTSMGGLTRVTGPSPSATFQHLARMYEEGLTGGQRDAQHILYSIKNAVVNSLIAALKTLYYP